MKPARIAFILAVVCFAVAAAIWLTACETITSEDGTRTSRVDTEAINGGIRAVDSGLNTFQRAQAIYNGQAYPVYPQPTP